MFVPSLKALCLTSLLAAGAAATASDTGVRKNLPSTAITTAPAIDGDISDDVWKSVPEQSGFWDTQNGVLVSDQTLVRVAYDSKYIYVAFNCLDSQPGGVYSQETREDTRYQNDGLGASEDVAEIRLDPYLSYDRQSQFWFSVNPTGVRSAFIGSGRAKKTEWKGEWKAAAKKTDTGWTAEMQIPWQILNYPTGKQTIGINFTRFQYRTKLESFWSNLGPERRQEYIGRWLDVQTPPAPRPSISVLPYILPGYDGKRGSFRSGLDLRYPISQDLTAVASVNPDFGTVEGAVDSVSFSRTERFLPERRPFFLEGQNYFSAGESFAIGRFFYPRRIEKFDLGTKVYGKVTPNDTVGVLHTIQFGERTDMVAKWNHKIGTKDNVFALVNHTNSRTREGTVGTAGFTQTQGKLSEAVQHAVSNQNGIRGNATDLSIAYEDKNNFHYLALQDTSRDFRLPDGLLGFTDFKGFMFYENWANEWRHGKWRFFNFEGGATMNWNHDGTPFQRSVNGNAVWLMFNDFAIQAEFDYSWYGESLDRTFTVGAGTDVTNRLKKIGCSVTNGTIDGQKYTNIGIEASRRLFGKIDLGGELSLVNLDGHEKLGILTATYELSPTRSFGGRLVEHNGDVNWYLSYRESAKMGMELFVILGDPNAEKFRSQLQVKMLLPFSIKT